MARRRDDAHLVAVKRRIVVVTDRHIVVLLGREKVHVHKRFHGDIARGDSYLASRPPIAATLPPPSYAQAR